MGISFSGCISGIVLLSQGVAKGNSGASILRRQPNKTIAPFSFPLYCSRSSSFSNVTPTTGPRTEPFVLGDHPAEASVNVCSVGRISRPLAGPRVQLLAIVQSSKCTLVRPTALHCSAVQWLAQSRCG